MEPTLQSLTCNSAAMKKDNIDIKKLQAFGKWILVKPANEDGNENPYGLLTPENTEKVAKVWGEILSIGSEVTNKQLKKGMLVVFGKYAGEDLEQDDEKKINKKIKYQAVHEDDIICFQP